MSHHVYTTRGIVLLLKPSRETDKTAIMFTKDLGLVHGTARGIRKPNSKISTSLLSLAVVKVSLVRGKHSWRVTTVSLIRDTSSELRGNRSALLALNRVCSLVMKLVRGEDKNVGLYDDLELSVMMLLEGRVDSTQVEAWELYAVSRILLHLGYITEESTPKNVKEALQNKKPLISLVNQGLRASELS
ncbi:MAG: DNA repair protein RecO [Minisyncoccota bacterium]